MVASMEPVPGVTGPAGAPASGAGLPCQSQAAENRVTRPSATAEMGLYLLEPPRMASRVEKTADAAIRVRGTPGYHSQPVSSTWARVCSPDSWAAPNRYHGKAADARARMAPKPTRATGEVALAGLGGRGGLIDHLGGERFAPGGPLRLSSGHRLAASSAVAVVRGIEEAAPAALYDAHGGGAHLADGHPRNVVEVAVATPHDNHLAVKAVVYLPGAAWFYRCRRRSLGPGRSDHFSPAGASHSSEDHIIPHARIRER